MRIRLVPDIQSIPLQNTDPIPTLRSGLVRGLANCHFSANQVRPGYSIWVSRVGMNLDIGN